MGRTVLSFPDEVFCYATELTVRGTDINAAFHLANDRLVAMLSEARFRYWIDAGMVEPGTSKGSLIVTDLVTVYRAEARPWDRLRFEMGLVDENRYGGDIAFQVVRPSDGILVALAKTGFVCFDYDAGRVVPMAPEVAERLRRPGTRFAC